MRDAIGAAKKQVAGHCIPSKVGKSKRANFSTVGHRSPSKEWQVASAFFVCPGWSIP